MKFNKPFHIKLTPIDYKLAEEDFELTEEHINRTKELGGLTVQSEEPIEPEKRDYIMVAGLIGVYFKNQTHITQQLIYI